MAIRLNSEKKIENEQFNLKIGTTNKIDPIVVYVDGKTFIEPLEDKMDYSKDMHDVKRALSSSIRKGIKSGRQFDDKFIVDFKISSSGISLGKKSFLSFQFLLRQRKDNVLKLKDLKEKEEGMLIKIVNELDDELSERGFVLSKTKK